MTLVFERTERQSTAIYVLHDLSINNKVMDNANSHPRMILALKPQKFIAVRCISTYWLRFVSAKFS